MTDYLQPTEPIPFDHKHRWLAFASWPRRSAARLTSTLHSAGVYAWNVQQSSTKVGTSEVGYTTMVEAVRADITPVKLAQRLGVNKLAVAYEPVPWSIELWVDAQEVIGPSPIPVDFLKDHERLNPGAYYGTLATWFGNVAPKMAEVAVALRGKGYDVLVDDSMVSGTTGTNKFFYIGTQDKNPTLAELRNIIKADALYINKHPFKDAQALKDLGGAKIALEKGLRDFSGSIADAGAAVIGLGTGAVKTIDTLSKVGAFLLYALPVVLVGGVGYWGYTKYKESL